MTLRSSSIPQATIRTHEAGFNPPLWVAISALLIGMGVILSQML